MNQGAIFSPRRWVRFLPLPGGVGWGEGERVIPRAFTHNETRYHPILPGGFTRSEQRPKPETLGNLKLKSRRLRIRRKHLHGIQ
jgi:hypothetical protein